MTAMPLYGIYIYSLRNWWAFYELGTGTQSTKREREHNTHERVVERKGLNLTTRVLSDVKQLL